MNQKTFELIAGHPALDFVNTLDDRFQEGAPKELLESYADLVAFVEQAGLLTLKQGRELERAAMGKSGERVLRAAMVVREALAAVLYAMIDGRKTPAADLKKLTDWIQNTRQKLGLAPERGRFAWRLPAEVMPEMPLQLLALSTEELLTSGWMELLRACAMEDCRWLFLDTSKNHTRRWCDMKICGNRVKARRFKAQHRGRV